MNSYFLMFYKPNFLMGTARTLDIAGTFTSYDFSKSSSELDYLSISSDWQAVGEDMTFSLKNYKTDE